MGTEPRSEVPLQTKQEDENQACHDWRDGKGKVNECGQNGPARELIPCDGPGCCHTEDHIEDHCYWRHSQRQHDGVTRVRIREQVLDVSPGPPCQGLVEHVDDRHDHQPTNDTDSGQYQAPSHQPGILQRRPSLWAILISTYVSSHSDCSTVPAD